ncbi:glycosyltransferase family 4 protein [Corynebacterium sp. H128]|uniref:MraY family glycosyltransferase n=1 Tax=Corynebacterium sp. H128 TaxID=3133427 RepID=UPI0030AFDF1E
MNTDLIDWIVVLAVGLTAAVSTFAWRPVLIKVGVVDIPNHRSSHARPTLRGGGVAPLTALSALLLLGSVLWRFRAEFDMMLLTLGAAIITGLLGLAEDIWGLPASMRALGQALIGTLLSLGLSTLSHTGWMLIPIAALFFVSNVNFTNFMDGINGISGLYAVSIGLVFSLIGHKLDLQLLVLVSASVAVAFAVFLFWNLTPPGMFLGDVGSYLLGGVTAGLALYAAWFGIPLIAVFAPFCIYWADAIFTLTKRSIAGQPIFEAHRMHTYQRLTDFGLSHIQVAIVVNVFTLLAGIVGLFAIGSTLQVSLIVVGVLVALCGVYLSLPSFLGHRKVGTCES